MFIVYFALWVILNGKWTTEIGIFGVIFAAALYAFSCRFMGYGFKEGSPLSAQTSHNDLLRGDAAGGDFQGQCHGHEDDSGQKL